MPPGGDGGRLSSPPSKAAFDAAAAAAGLAPWNSRSSSSPSEKRPLTLYARPAAAPLLRLAARTARGALAAHERSLGTRYALPHLQKHNIDYVIHGDDPCLLPVRASGSKRARFSR